MKCYFELKKAASMALISWSFWLGQSSSLSISSCVCLGILFSGQASLVCQHIVIEDHLLFCSFPMIEAYIDSAL